MDEAEVDRTLHHEIVDSDGDSATRLYVLHGIFGAGRNWSSVARRLVDRRSDVDASLVDLRQHGESMGFAPPHTLAAAAEDLERLHAGGRHAVLGHSFGGKVALVYARRAATPPAQVWVIDSTPEAGPPEGSAWEMLDVLRAVPDRFTERSDGVAALVGEGVAEPVARWMATNLVRDGDGDLGWRISLDDMEALLLDFFRTDAWDVVERPPEGCRVHVVKARESDVLSAGALERVRRAGDDTGRVFLHVLDGGHWLNADNPDDLVDVLAARLD